jgi:predicted transposase/invertase (TIGR01784 family)
MALGGMPDSFVLKAFLMAHRAEIKGMFLEDYNEESFRREMRVEGYEDGRKEGREEGRKEGREEGHEEGRKEGHEEVATNMLKKGMPLPLIAEVCMMPEDKIKELAAELGIELGSEPS